MKMFKIIGAGVIAVSLIASVAPASPQWRHRGYHHHRGAGLGLGLATGLIAAARSLPRGHPTVKIIAAGGIARTTRARELISEMMADATPADKKPRSFRGFFLSVHPRHRKLFVFGNAVTEGELVTGRTRTIDERRDRAEQPSRRT